MLKRKLFSIWLFFHKIKCNFWNGYLMALYKQNRLETKYITEHEDWKDDRTEFQIKHKKMPLSLKDFRLYVYLKKVGK